MKKYDYANLFYFRFINHIGGTEQFLYEIAKKYHDRDIVIMYDEIDPDQLMRLRQLVRCVRREVGKRYRVKRAFYSYTTEILPQIEADEHIFVCHAIYQKIMMEPPIAHPEITRWICVSKYAADSFKTYADKMGKKVKPEICYNPLSIEKPQKILKIISAGRLEDVVKGGQRTEKLIRAVEKYAARTNRKYLWMIFSNPNTRLNISTPNVVFMEPRIDVRDFIADADWLVQLSDDMESYGYSINEALAYGTGVVCTPLSVLEELKVPKNAYLECDYDMKNADKVAKKMFEPSPSFKYKPPIDCWDKLLDNEPSHYKPPKLDTVVQCVTDYNDLELNRLILANSKPYKVTRERAEYLQGRGLVVILEGEKGWEDLKQSL